MKIPVKIFLLLYFLFLSCEKSEPKSILETRKGYLTGIGNSTTNWKLKGITIDGLPQQLSGSQLSYTKQYFSSLKFSELHFQVLKLFRLLKLSTGQTLSLFLWHI